MRILTRYVLWEVTAVFLATLATMTVFVFVALIGKEAVENGLGPGAHPADAAVHAAAGDAVCGARRPPDGGHERLRPRVGVE